MVKLFQLKWRKRNHKKSTNPRGANKSKTKENKNLKNRIIGQKGTNNKI